MYYKIIRNTKVVDVLDEIKYVKYQLKHKVLLLCDESEAQGILSSDGEHAWHISALLPFPVDNVFETVSIEQINKVEYERLKRLNMQTPEEIAEEIILDMIGRGVI